MVDYQETFQTHNMAVYKANPKMTQEQYQQEEANYQAALSTVRITIKGMEACMETYDLLLELQGALEVLEDASDASYGIFLAQSFANAQDLFQAFNKA